MAKKTKSNLPSLTKQMNRCGACGRKSPQCPSLTLAQRARLLLDEGWVYSKPSAPMFIRHKEIQGMVCPMCIPKAAINIKEAPSPTTKRKKLKSAVNKLLANTPRKRMSIIAREVYRMERIDKRPGMTSSNGLPHMGTDTLNVDGFVSRDHVLPSEVRYLRLKEGNEH